MNTNELKERIKAEAEQNGFNLTEDELNAKVLEASRMDPEKMERVSGGGVIFNCTKDNFCWSDYCCVSVNKECDSNGRSCYPLAFEA